MIDSANPILAEANRAFRAKRFAEAAALYRRAFDAGDAPVPDQLRYGLCCLFSGNREEFDRIHRRYSAGSETAPTIRALLKRYAALSVTLSACVMLSACDRVTYPYEKKKKTEPEDPEVIIVTPPIMKYGAPPVVSLYAVSPTAPIYPDRGEEK